MVARLLWYYPNLTPDLVDNFTNQGATNSKSSEETGLNIGIPITYRAGDQPNNALALNVFDNGEVAASGGTSGVIYSITKDITLFHHLFGFCYLRFQLSIS